MMVRQIDKREIGLPVLAGEDRGHRRVITLSIDTIDRNPPGPG